MDADRVDGGGQVAAGHPSGTSDGPSEPAPFPGRGAARILAELQSEHRVSASPRSTTPTALGAALRERTAAIARAAAAFVVGRPGVVVLAAAVVLAVAALVAALIVRGSTDATEIRPPVTVPAATTSTTGVSMVVQAAGAVRSPGVHRLPIGSRVVDLLERAGGPSLDLDLERVNLAAVLADGQRIWFPRIGESASGPVDTTGAAAGSTPALVDVNHATVDQLDALPGIGPVLAAAIVADRSRRGRFGDVEALARVKGLTRSRIDALRDLVTFG